MKADCKLETSIARKTWPKWQHKKLQTKQYKIRQQIKEHLKKQITENREEKRKVSKEKKNGFNIVHASGALFNDSTS